MLETTLIIFRLIICIIVGWTVGWILSTIVEVKDKNNRRFK